MKTFNVLPTDPKFLDLTEFQREFLWENFLLDNPEIEAKMKKAQEDDPDFDQEWEELDKPDTTNDETFETEDDEFTDAEKAFESFLSNSDDLNIPDVDETLRKKGIVLPKTTEVSDWEEVE